MSTASLSVWGDVRASSSSGRLPPVEMSLFSYPATMKRIEAELGDRVP